MVLSGLSKDGKPIKKLTVVNEGYVNVGNEMYIVKDGKIEKIQTTTK